MKSSAFALVTGASSGLGIDFAKRLAERGYSLILVARRSQPMQELATALKARHAGLTVHVIEGDLGKPGAGRELYDQVRLLGGDVEILINNAGFGAAGNFAELPLADQLQMIDLNVRTVVELTHLFLPSMKKNGRGRILNVGSAAGFLPGPYMTIYYATKAFVNSFSEGLHEELKGTGVSCTGLAPTATATGFSKAAGTEKSGLFTKTQVATSDDVVEAGLKALFAGEAMSVPGLMNKLMTQSLRLSPRFVMRKVAASLNRPPDV